MNKVMTAFSSCNRGIEKATVLIVAIWVVLVLAGVTLVFTRSARVEAIASANEISIRQAECIARGALRYAQAQIKSAGRSVAALDEAAWEGVPVGNGFFWVLRPNRSDEGGYDFGLVDEASKVNLNSASSEILLKLPGMTSELAAAMIDWRDEGDEVSPGGAENEYYLLLSDPYYCKNAPFESVEELVLVRGASRDLLFGEDTNRNGALDPNENDGGESEPPDNRDGRLDPGFYSDVTVYSSEPNVSADGKERVNVNRAGAPDLAELLRKAVPGDRFFAVMDRVRGGRPFRNVLDFYFKTGLKIEEFKQIADRLTTSRQERSVGLLNINTTPRRVLLYLPGLDESDVDAILSKRSAAGVNLDNLAWVAEALPREKAVAIGEYITTRSYQFSADIVALSGDGRAWKRYRAVIDATEETPRVVAWQDLTHLGWPLAPEILADARAGKTAE